MSELSAAQAAVVGAPSHVPDGVERPEIRYDIHDLGELPFNPDIYQRTSGAGAENRALKVPRMVGYAAVVRVAGEERPGQRWYAMCDGAGMWAADREAAVAEIERYVAFTASFWMEKVGWRLAGDRNRLNGNPVVRCDGSHYVLGSGNSGMRGVGGRPFRFRMLADGRVVKSTDVWFQGVIPAEFRDLLPDNAEAVA